MNSNFKKNRKYTRLLACSAIALAIMVALVAGPQPAIARTPWFIAGIADFFGTSENKNFPEAEDVEPKYEIRALFTAYSSDVWQTDSTPCIPAMSSFDLCENYEKFGIENTIAANFLPLGTRVQFESPELPEFDGKIFIVRDRMNAKYNGSVRADIWMPTYKQAKNFGVKWIKIKIYPHK